MDRQQMDRQQMDRQQMDRLPSSGCVVDPGAETAPLLPCRDSSSVSAGRDSWEWVEAEGVAADWDQPRGCYCWPCCWDRCLRGPSGHRLVASVTADPAAFDIRPGIDSTAMCGKRSAGRNPRWPSAGHRLRKRSGHCSSRHRRPCPDYPASESSRRRPVKTNGLANLATICLVSQMSR